MTSTKNTSTPAVDPSLMSTLRWRNIGPHRGGRVVAVAGHPTETMTFYFGACDGGVWKTDDGGTYWRNVSDGFFRTAPVGAIAVAESDPNVIYAGTGESCVRGNVSPGDGVYKTTDGGKTWKHVGLEATKHIARIRVHPNYPDIVYVAALGNIFGDSEERGIFRSRDGGKTWEKVLYKSPGAGAADLNMDPNNPRILFATIWQARRQPWNFSSGGTDSGLWRSTDGGDTWEDITGKEGLPKGIKGRIGVAISPARPDRVWAIVEAKDRGLFRSDDGGEKWTLVSDNGGLMQRPWYYSHVFGDPQDAETVWVLNETCWKSTDGGKNFEPVGTPHGDNHDIWIDPRNTRRMIEGNDGGACVTFNGAETWSTIYNQPTAQIYRMDSDNQFPYKVYGTQQDNSAISVPSRSPSKGAILYSECEFVGSSESGQVAVDPRDPNIIYTGAIGSSSGGGDSLLRFDRRIEQTRHVSVWPEYVWGYGVKDHKHRFQWTYPIGFSPHDKKTLYVAAEKIFRSTNEGQSWEAISPDLTRNDVSKMGPSGGPITHDTTFVEHVGTIFALAESPHQKGLFWVASDDGLVHISRDGAKTWENITPSGLPEWTTIAVLDLSPFDAGTAYFAGHRYRLDDPKPYIYKTTDYGKTWTKITGGLPDDDWAWCVRSDTVRQGLLYAGTERGVYVSYDDGGSWQPLRANLPAVPVRDIHVKGNELAIATHGRSFWVLDDLTLVRQLADAANATSVRLFTPADTYRIAPQMTAGRSSNPTGKKYLLSLAAHATWEETTLPTGEVRQSFLDAGVNPPGGGVITYRLPEGVEKDGAKMTILDSKGNEVRSYAPKADAEPRDRRTPPGQKPKEPEGPFMLVEPGMNRAFWDMHYEKSSEVTGDAGADSEPLPGPFAPPGEYTVRIEVGGVTQTAPFRLLADPRIATPASDYAEQTALMLRIRDKVSEVHDAINRIRSVRKQVDEWTGRAKGLGGAETLEAAGKDLKEKLTSVEDELIQPRSHGGLDQIATEVKLNMKLKEIIMAVNVSDTRPTDAHHAVFTELSARADRQLARLKEVLDNELPKFTALVGELKVPAVKA